MGLEGSSLTLGITPMTIREEGAEEDDDSRKHDGPEYLNWKRGWWKIHSPGPFERDGQLEECDCRAKPGIWTHYLNTIVDNELIIFTQGWGDKDSHQAKAEDGQRMRRRNPKESLKEEAAQLDKFCHEDEIQDIKEPFPAAEHIPIERGPLLRQEELHCAQSTANLGGNLALLGIAHPIVRSHLEPLHDGPTTNDASTIGDDEIQDDMVPPALIEVLQNVSEGELHELENDTADQRETHIAEDEHFDEPSYKVCEEELILDGISDVTEGRDRVLWGVNAAIHSIAALRERLAEVRIDEPHEMSGVIEGLEEKEDENKQVEQSHAHDDPPDQHVGATEDGVGELDHSKDEEGHSGAEQSKLHVRSSGRASIAREGKVEEGKPCKDHRRHCVRLSEYLRHIKSLSHFFFWSCYRTADDVVMCDVFLGKACVSVMCGLSR